MKIEKIKNRSVVYSKNINQEWDLHIHVIHGSKYNYLIDTGLGSEHIKPIVEHLQQEKKEVIVINTHYHWDHIWGNYLFKDSKIIAHSKCREILEVEWDEIQEKYQQYIEGETHKCLPNLTFDTEIYFPEDKIRIFYTPGHSVDCISVLDEVDKVLNVGDNIGDTIEEIVPSLACDKSVYRESLLRYKELDFDTVISGHNVVLDKSVIDRILGLL